MKIKKVVKKLMPPILLDLLRLIYNPGIKFQGNYSSWEEALRDSTGYDNPEILKKVRESALKVKKGEAVYERDGVIFDEIQYSWPLLAGLMYTAAKSGGILKVCDFGGSLGTSYFQNRKFLTKFPMVRWGVVEQKEFVDIGRIEFQDDKLRFYYDVNECVNELQPTVLLLSGVLQFIDEPYELLTHLLSFGFDYVLIDRTPFGKRKECKIQVVSEYIYKASYPSWIFEEREFTNVFQKLGYSIIEKFEAIDSKIGKYQFLGFIMEKV